MALQFNSFVGGQTGIPLGFIVGAMGSGTSQIRIYPNTVSYPSSAPDLAASLPAGHILTYSGFSFSNSSIPGSIVFSGATGTSATTTAAGTLAWAAFINSPASSPAGIFITDAVVLNGGNGVISVSTLTPGNAQSVTITFVMKFTV